MLDRSQVKAFKAASWNGTQEAERFVASLGRVEAPDIANLLGILTDRSTMADAGRHRLRCAVFARLATGVRDRSLFQGYIRALKIPDRQLRATLTPLIPPVTPVAKHRELCELFRAPDEELRTTLANVLKEIGGKTVLQLLSDMVGEKDFVGRREAIDLLVPMAGHYSIPALRAALAVGKPMEKRQCLKYLGDQRYMGKNPQAALEAIATGLADPNDNVAAQAVAAFAALCSEEAYFEQIVPMLDSERQSTVKAVVLGLARFPSPRSLRTFERKLRGGPNSVRLAVLDSLETIGTDDVLPGLVAGLSHKNITVRTRAGEIMGRLSQAGQIDLARTITWLLRSKDVGLRRSAADLARSVSDPKGLLWPKLLRFLRDEDWWVRERVMDALIEVAGTQLSPLLADYLSDPSDVVRRFAVEAFFRLKDPETLGLLVQTATEDSDWWVRERAIEAVAAIGDQRAVPHLVHMMQTHPDLQLVCLQALMDMNANTAAAQVGALLSADNPDVRVKAVKCLGDFNDRGHTHTLESLADDPNQEVRTAAMELLTRWEIEVQRSAETGVSTLDALLMTCAEQEGDDLILAPGYSPYIKRLGRVLPLEERPLTARQVEALLLPHLSLVQREDLKALRDVDFSHEVISKRLRFRANVFRQLGGLSAVFRIVKGTIPDLEELGLPPVAATFGDFRNGLVLVGGPTGSGKSTTLAAIIDYINRTSSRHIISLEDPIEVLHPKKQGLVNQREMGTHTSASATALRSTLRQDPDVLLIGEMRDLPTISFAVAAAETGHLVFGTLHTVSADTTVDRLINAFPDAQQQQVRSMLADSLRAVLCQLLLPRMDGTGRCLAAEVLLNNDAVANVIRKGKTYQLPSIIATSREQGMHSMDGELKRLVQAGLVAPEEAYMRAANKKDFEGPDDTTPEEPGTGRQNAPPAKPGRQAGQRHGTD